MHTAKTKNRRIFWCVFFSVFFCLALACVGAAFRINESVKNLGKSRTISVEDAVKMKNIDCILVLGCLVRDDGTPSDMLRDRLNTGVTLYNLGASSKLLMSGDHGREEYNEVGAMKDYAVDAGVPSSDVFMDHAGFSTYESVYRAKNVFKAKKILVVTQEYHLYRALYIAEKLGLEAYGVASDRYTYVGQSARDFREFLARVKDFFTVAFEPVPPDSEVSIPIFGDGNDTNDRRTELSVRRPL